MRGRFNVNKAYLVTHATCYTAYQNAGEVVLQRCAHKHSHCHHERCSRGGVHTRCTSEQHITSRCQYLHSSYKLIRGLERQQIHIQATGTCQTQDLVRNQMLTADTRAQKNQCSVQIVSGPFISCTHDAMLQCETSQT